MRRQRGLLLPRIGAALITLGLALRLGKTWPSALGAGAVAGAWLIGIGVILILLKWIAQLLFRHIPKLRKAAGGAMMLEFNIDPPRPYAGQACRVKLRLTSRKEKSLEKVTVTILQQGDEPAANASPTSQCNVSSSTSLTSRSVMAAGRPTEIECSILVPGSEAMTPNREETPWRMQIEVKTNARTPFFAIVPFPVEGSQARPQ